MNPRSHFAAGDRPCPLPFLVTAAFASGLIWLFAVLGQLPLP
jgi:hypothetical protein